MNSTAALIISVVIAFGITAGLGFVIIPWLRKLKFGQTILDIGPKWHKSKQGTPNMGGLMFIIGIAISFSLTVLIYHLSGGNLESEYSSIMNGRELVLLLAGLILALGCGAVGFIDDFTKIKLKRNEGLSPKQKTLGQLIVTLGYIATLWMSHNTSWYIPFIGRVNFEKNIFTAVVFWILSIFIVYGCVNSVNLTDGIDGLCSSVTSTVAIAFIVLGYIQGFAGLTIFSGALLGGVLGFLCWNWIILLPIGIVYVCETMSDIIQIGYFKITHGKRVFKMAPIHHHFEMCGWKEKKICVVFSLVNAIGCVIGVLLLLYFGNFAK